MLDYYRVNHVDSLLFFAENLQFEEKEDRFSALKELAFAEHFCEIYELTMSLSHVLDAIYFFEKQSYLDIESIARSYNLAGICSEQLYRYEKALEYYEKAIGFAQSFEDQQLIAEIYSNRSFVYYGNGDFAKAVTDLEKAIEISTQLNDTVNISKDLNNIGFIYTSWHKYEVGIEYYKKALELSTQFGLNEHCAICCNNIGMSYYQQANYNLAEKYIKQALEIDLKNGLYYDVAKRYNNLGLVYFQQGKVEESIKHFEMAAEVFLEKSDSINYAKSIINIADTYFKIGKNIEAFQYLQKGYSISLRTNSLPLIEHNTGKMYQYYKNIGDFEQALKYKELHDELGDSIYSLESAKVIEEMEILYKTEKREEEISRLNSESALKEDIIRRKTQQKNFYAIFAALLFIVLVATILIYIKIRGQSRKLEILNNVKNRLFAIISHDLRGYSSVFQDAGMVIRHHLKKENYDKVNSISENLEISAISYSNQLDNILSWSTLQLNGYKLNPVEFAPYVECEKSIEILSKSHTLKANTFKNNINSELLLIMDKGAFDIILRNLLENANKFTECGKISVDVDKYAKGFKIIVTDTGIGMSKEIMNNILFSETTNSQRGTRGEKGSGVGLGLVKTFVKMSGGKLYIESEQGKGAKFVIEFYK